MASFPPYPRPRSCKHCCKLVFDRAIRDWTRRYVAWMNGLEGPSDFEMDKEATAVGQYLKIKAWLDNLELLYGNEDISLVGLLYEPNYSCSISRSEM